MVRVFLVREESRTEVHGWQLMPMSSVRIECPAEDQISSLEHQRPA